MSTRKRRRRIAMTAVILKNFWRKKIMCLKIRIESKN
jgi:hypothetical protein